jgi:uncharacterized OB-fold protein
VRRLSNEKPYNKEIRKHIETVRCPKCGAYYVAEDGHVCDKSASRERMDRK